MVCLGDTKLPALYKLGIGVHTCNLRISSRSSLTIQQVYHQAHHAGLRLVLGFEFRSSCCKTSTADLNTDTMSELVELCMPQHHHPPHTKVVHCWDLHKATTISTL